MQRTHFLGWLLIMVIGLTGCHSMSGNVVPQSGPAMEEVYDSMGVHHAKTQAITAGQSVNDTDENTQSEADLDDIRRAQSAIPVSKSSSLSASVGKTSAFRPLSNPELKLYVYPHFAGSDEVPIPGYYTVFNAYEKTYYALPTDATH